MREDEFAAKSRNIQVTVTAAVKSSGHIVRYLKKDRKAESML